MYLEYYVIIYNANFFIILQQMMLVPLAVVLFAAFVNAEPAINEARPHSNRPGRFLSLPIPQKCSNRKYEIRLFF